MNEKEIEAIFVQNGELLKIKMVQVNNRRFRQQLNLYTALTTPLPRPTITAVVVTNAFGISSTQIEIHTNVNIL